MKKSIALFALAAAMVVPATRADTGYYLVTPYPDEGAKVIDFKYWNAKPTGKPPVSSPELGVGYNVNSRWFTELSSVWSAISPDSPRQVAWEWQNDFMLTHGQYPIDVALHTSYEHNNDPHDGVGFEWGPAIQTEYYRTQFNFNLFFQRDFRVAQAEPWELAYEWQVRQHWKRAFDFGVQGFGEVGKWNHWDPRSEQSHRAGPAVFGTLDMGGRQAFKYEAAYLIGKNNAMTARSVTLRLQYVF